MERRGALRAAGAAVALVCAAGLVFNADLSWGAVWGHGWAAPRELQQKMTVNVGHQSGISGPEAERRNEVHKANWALSRHTEDQGWTNSKHLYKVPPFNNEPYREDLGYWSKTKQPTPLWVDLPGSLAQPAPGQPGPDGVPESGTSDIRWGAPVARKMPEALLDQLQRMERLREQVSAANAQSQQLLESVLPLPAPSDSRWRAAVWTRKILYCMVLTGQALLDRTGSRGGAESSES